MSLAGDIAQDIAYQGYLLGKASSGNNQSPFDLATGANNSPCHLAAHLLETVDVPDSVGPG